MSLPSEKTMPIVTATWTPGRGFRIALPNGRERLAIDEAEVRRICAREVPGTSIRFSGSVQPPRGGAAKTGGGVSTAPPPAHPAT